MNMFQILGYLSPVLVPLVVSTFLLSGKGRHPAKVFLALLMVVLSFSFLCNFFYFESDFKIYSYLHSLHVAALLFIYPSVYVYIFFLTREKVPFKTIIVHYLPAIIFSLFSAILFYLFLNSTERIEYLSNYRLNHDFENLYMRAIYFLRILNIVCLFIQIPLYFILSNQYLKKHKLTIENHYSETHGFDLGWIRKFNIVFFLAAVISIFFYTVNPVKLLGNDIYLMVPLYVLSFIMCGFGIIGNNQDRVIIPKDLKSEIFQVKDSGLKHGIEKLLIDEKIYLIPGLKIADMAVRLKTNRTYLSQEINRNFQVNFSQLINNYRLEEAKRILKTEESRLLPLEQVAEMCGWGSLSSLNRAFKYDGHSPARYKKTKNG